MQKFFCLITALLILISVIAACGDSNSGSNETTTAAANVDTTESVDSRPPLNVPVKDYGGYQFRILAVNSTVTGNNTQPGLNYYSDFIYVPESAGEPVNDAIYERNLKMSEDFGIEIVTTEVAEANVTAEARKSIMSGEDVYDLIQPIIDHSFQLAQEKYIYNLYNVPYLELSNTWWDQALIKNLSLNNKLYTITGDISRQDEDLNWAIGINKVLMQQYDVPDLYQLVRDGKWTFDAMYNVGKSVTYDFNGDGVLDWEDVYAFGNDYTGSPFYFFAAGENIAVLDKDGYPQFTIGNERAINVVDKLTAIFNDTNFMIWVSKMTASENGWTVLRIMFRENRLMMFSMSMYTVKEFRGMVDDFGILPGPKYDEQQEKYYMIASTHGNAGGVCIPITVLDLERTGIVLEAMAYHSKPIQVAYYDINLTGKFTRDEESREMLDIIFENITYDIGKAFGWGGFWGQIQTAVQKNTGFAALVEANKVRAETEMQKSYDIFLEIDG